jgi:beta-phosphoglucomutase-like phosphatase (HAD superfamily)
MEQSARSPRSQISYQLSAISGSRPCFGAIFDWDGVMIDSAELHEQSWHRLATELGKPIAPGSFLHGFGMKSAWIIEKIHCWATEPAEVARLTDRKEALYREIVAQSEIAPLPGAVTWLERLDEAGVPCAVASSTHRRGRARWDRSRARGRHEGGGGRDHAFARGTEGSGPCR